MNLRLVSIVAVVAGCNLSSSGQLGHAQFAWANCAIDDCAVRDGAIAAGGAQDRIQVTLAPGYSVAQVRSSNPGVATFALEANPAVVDVTGVAAGQAQLELLDAKGQLVDQAAIAVADVAQLTVDPIWQGTSSRALLEGATLPFHVTTENVPGNTLYGTGAVQFDFTGTLRRIAGLTIGDEVFVGGDAGTGTVTARTAEVALVESITVVSAGDVTSLAATAHPGQPSTSNLGFTQEVDVVAGSAAGSLYGAACSWTVSDPTSVAVAEQLPATSGGQTAETTLFTLAQPGQFSAVCTIGAQSATVQLQR